MNYPKNLSWSGKKTFITFLCIHFIVWSLIPLLRNTLSMDTLEAAFWGKLYDWGTNKHPPLSGWIANTFFILGKEHDFSLYIVNQVFIIIGFIYIYKIARFFMDREKAILAVMLLEGVGRYTRSSYEFTNNIVCLALWPMAVYYFYKSLKDGHLKYWILFGISIGLNLLNKYMSGVLLLGMSIFMLSNKEYRKQLLKPQIYIAALIAVVIITPHIIWLHKTDWFSIYYFSGDRLTSKNKFGEWGRIYYPLNFIFTILLLTIPTIIAFCLLRYKAVKEAKPVNKENTLFILLMGVLPTIGFAAIGIVSANEVKHTWGFPLYYMLGIILFYFFPFKLTKKLFSKAVIIVYVLMTLMIINRICYFSTTTNYNRNINRNDFIHPIEEIWAAETDNAPFAYVAGDLFFMCNMSLYSDKKPIGILPTAGHKNPWVDLQDVKERGVMSFSRKPEAGYKSFDMYITNLWGKKESFTLYYQIQKGTKN